ncbi:MAG: hypothetical protein ACKV2U_12095 [Bryobacteraceae bacterium]
MSSNMAYLQRAVDHLRDRGQHPATPRLGPFVTTRLQPLSVL